MNRNPVAPLTDDADLQVYILKPLILINFDQNAEADNSVSFRVEVPDSRLRCNVALIGEPRAGAANNFIGSKAMTLWLREVEDSIQFGTSVPCTNLWGTSAAPGAFPGTVNAAGAIVADTALGGFSREFVTAGRAIVGTVRYQFAFNSGLGDLALQVRYTPEAGMRFSAKEWQAICNRAGRSFEGAGPINGA